MDLASDSVTDPASDSATDLDSLINDPKIVPPEAWTKEKGIMEYQRMWVNSNSTLQKMIRAYELGTAKPIMGCDRDSGDTATLFQAGTKYCFWMPDAQEIWEIITSMSLKDLITQIGEQGRQSLKIVRVPD